MFLTIVTVAARRNNSLIIYNRHSFAIPSCSLILYDSNSKTSGNALDMTFPPNAKRQAMIAHAADHPK